MADMVAASLITCYRIVCLGLFMEACGDGGTPPPQQQQHRNARARATTILEIWDQRGMRTWEGEDKGLFSVACSFNYFHFHDDENADKCALNQNINQNITVVGIDP